MGRGCQAQGCTLTVGDTGIQLACQVVPEIPSFSVDDGFTYAVPPVMPIEIGSKVRVRVSGRRLAGYVTAVFPRPEDRKLLAVDSVTGSHPVFDEHLLATCRWAARHYVAPLSTILKRTSPPNAPRQLSREPRRRQDGVSHSTSSVIYVVSPAPHHEAIRDAVSTRIVGTTLAIIVPTAFEVTELASHLKQISGSQVVAATSSMPAKDVTEAWMTASQDPGTILVGTREIALWSLAGGGSFVVVEDGRRVMKSPSTPTLHVRDIVLRRSEATEAHTTFLGPVPTLEMLHRGVEVKRTGGRSWSPVEIVDRTEEPPGSPMIAARTRSAIAAAVKGGTRVFVLVTARGYAPAFKCRSCGTLRDCRICGTTATAEKMCRRCSAALTACAQCGENSFMPLGAGIGRIVDEIASFVGSEVVGTSDDGLLVTVGSERDLVELLAVGLGVVVDLDGMSGAPHYRANEDALRLIVRLAHRVARGDRNRVVAQTSAVDQPIVTALETGKAAPFLQEESESRRKARFPPFAELIAIEVAGDADADSILRECIGEAAEVRGPAAMRDRNRWLIQGSDLSDVRIALRGAVGSLRAQGAKVRVDADPIDL